MRVGDTVVEAVEIGLADHVNGQLVTLRIGGGVEGEDGAAVVHGHDDRAVAAADLLQHVIAALGRGHGATDAQRILAVAGDEDVLGHGMVGRLGWGQLRVGGGGGGAGGETGGRGGMQAGGIVHRQLGEHAVEALQHFGAALGGAGDADLHDPAPGMDEARRRRQRTVGCVVIDCADRAGRPAGGRGAGIGGAAGLGAEPLHHCLVGHIGGEGGVGISGQIDVESRLNGAILREILRIIVHRAAAIGGFAAFGQGQAGDGLRQADARSVGADGILRRGPGFAVCGLRERGDGKAQGGRRQKTSHETLGALGQRHPSPDLDRLGAALNYDREATD